MNPSDPQNDNEFPADLCACREVRESLGLKSTCCRLCHMRKSFTTVQVDEVPALLCCVTLSEVIHHHGQHLGNITEERIRYLVKYLQRLINSG